MNLGLPVRLLAILNNKNKYIYIYIYIPSDDDLKTTIWSQACLHARAHMILHTRSALGTLELFLVGAGAGSSAYIGFVCILYKHACCKKNMHQ